VVRIDEVEKEGVNKIIDNVGGIGGESNVAAFPPGPMKRK